jgi:hypothetical protein
MTQITGTPDSADKMGQRIRSGSFDRLEEAGITSFFRPAQLEAVGLTRDQLPALVRSGTVGGVGRGL